MVRMSKNTRKARPLLTLGRIGLALLVVAASTVVLVRLVPHQLLLREEEKISLLDTPGAASPASRNIRKHRIPLKDGGFCPNTACPFNDADTKRIREAWTEAPNLPDEMEGDASNLWVNPTIPDGNNSTMQMLVRDIKRDKFISAFLAQGITHDGHIRTLLGQYLQQSSGNPPVFVDVGANIGYFTMTALALGAKVISFEPFRYNMGVLMSSVRRNAWRERAHLYMNAVSFENVRVLMESTNTKINLSNMHVRSKECIPSYDKGKVEGTYGLDYMDAVSLDQVMLEKHSDITTVELMKIDVERFEVEVLNGAMSFLCNRVVKRIAVEVGYLKVSKELPNISCNFEALHDTLTELGYTTWDVSETMDFTDQPLEELPMDVVYRLEHQEQPPAQRLLKNSDNPCRDFTKV